MAQRHLDVLQRRRPRPVGHPGRRRPELRGPAADFTIDQDSWDVQGLKGTGSKSVTLQNVFVPDYRTHLLVDTYNDANPGWKVNNRPLYWVSFTSLFNSTPTNSAIGAATGGIETFIEQSRVRLTRQGTGAPAAQNPFLHLKVAEARTRVRTVQERHLKNWRELFDIACRGEVATPTRADAHPVRGR